MPALGDEDGEGQTFRLTQRSRDGHLHEDSRGAFRHAALDLKQE
jgi:hypothetical protein